MNVQVVLGSRTAANMLTGSNVAASVLIGGAASDVLTAGTARAVLIGGLGADVLRGGPADDILIGGYTSFDANVAALRQILAEWGSADSFTDRGGGDPQHPGWPPVRVAQVGGGEGAV